MEKKLLKKKSTTWKCPKNCELKNKPCKHLESLLPQMGDGSISKSTAKAYQGTKIILDEENLGSLKVYDRIERKLASKGFKDYEINLIMDRFVSKLTIGEITDKHGYLSSYTVRNLLSKLTDVLEFMGGTSSDE